ncbi:Teneurin-3 [Dissostichus eleginoides]|nr:Teneurin-3 [Dissostichus eleginoides]
MHLFGLNWQLQESEGYGAFENGGGGRDTTPNTFMVSTDNGKIFLLENNTIDTGEVDVGRRAIQDVPPGVFWRSQLYIDQPQFLKFNISVQKDALVGVYGRKGLPPSHTQYDFVELLDGSRLISKDKRSLSDTDAGHAHEEGSAGGARHTRSVNVHGAGFIQYLDTGIWHLAMYNDGRNTEQVSYNTIAIAACPVLCSGNGQYSRGRCQCYSGWKGTECDVPVNQCIDIHCGGHGICIVGACICNTGYKGDNCEEVDCIDPSCSAHGVCIHGECHCQPGWGGASCEIAKAMCPDQCSGHGTHNAETSTCSCDQNWTGPDCSLGVLRVQCLSV